MAEVGDRQSFLRDGKAFTVRTFSDRVQHNNPTRLDRRGLPWFYLTEASGSCFVRAHRRYLAL
jgi:hypothetical protein